MRGVRLVQNKGYKKCTTAVLLAVVLCFGAVAPLPAAGQTPTAASAAARIRQGLLASAACMDLSDCGLSPSDLGRVYTAVLQDDPALFFVAPRLSYATAGGVVTTVYPAYTLAGEELAAARVFYRETLAAMLCEVEIVLGGRLSDEAAVALAVHDLLADRYDYDVGAFAGSAGNADAYTLFRDGVGVCQAYAMAAIALLRAAGMEADLVTSAAMNHAWVHVRVGGAWYHMDVTRDDPVATLPDGSAVPAGKVTHTRVLRSDAGMQSLGYRDYTCAGGHVCTDARYENSTAVAVLSALSEPLRAVSAGKDVPLVWIGETDDGVLVALRWNSEGITPHAAWDIDGDGTLTPGDLLVLSDDGIPEAWREGMRRALVGN